MRYNVTMVTKVKDYPTIITKGHLASLGKKKDRWCIILPPRVTGYLGKKTEYKIRLIPIGSVNPVHIIGIT